MGFVVRIACDHIAARHTRQVVGSLAQLVRQQIRLVAALVGAINLLFSPHIKDKGNRQHDQQTDGQPQTATKQGASGEFHCLFRAIF